MYQEICCNRWNYDKMNWKHEELFLHNHPRVTKETNNLLFISDGDVLKSLQTWNLMMQIKLSEQEGNLKYPKYDAKAKPSLRNKSSVEKLHPRIFLFNPFSCFSFLSLRHSEMREKNISILITTIKVFGTNLFYFMSLPKLQKTLPNERKCIPAYAKWNFISFTSTAITRNIFKLSSALEWVAQKKRRNLWCNLFAHKLCTTMKNVKNLLHFPMHR